MRKTTGAAVAAAALVGVSAFGVGALPSSAAPETATSNSQPDTRHMRWTLRETAGEDVGRSYVSTDVIRSRVTGEIVGYDSGVAKLHQSQNRLVWRVAFALEDGIIVARLNVHFSEDQHRGPILSGSGRYREIEGTMTSRQLDNGDTRVTLHYQL